MNRFKPNLIRWNFRKIARVYLIVLLAAAAACAAAAGYVYRSRIAFAWQYARVGRAAEKGDSAALRSELYQLAAASSDVTDILILDESNNVTFSAKNSEFSAGPFNLSRSAEDRNYLSCGTDADVVFRYVKSDDFMLSSVFHTDFGAIRDQYRDDNFFENGFSSKTVYLLSFLGEKDSGGKIYIISSPTSVPGGKTTLKAAAVCGILLLMCFWVLLALWAFQNAAKARLDALLWGTAVLLTNLVGVLVYEIYKHANISCSVCGASQSRLHRFCTGCGARLGETCAACGSPIGRDDLYCPNCGAATDRKDR